MKYFISFFLLVTMLAACAPAPVDDGELADSELRRETAPLVTAQEAQTLQEGNTLFALDLYHQVSDQPGNLVFSPYSISLAFAMLSGGARGDSAAQLAQVLHFDLPQEQLHAAMNALSLDLALRESQSKQIDRKHPMTLDIANAVWGQQEYPFEPAYLDLLAVNYGAGVRLVDFSNPEAARDLINSWAKRETDGNIPEVLPEGAPDPDTRLMLANAIYFEAAWQKAFVESRTREGDFTLLDGSTVQVTTMHTDKAIPFLYTSGEGFSVAALPYKGNLAEMIIIMPEEGQFEEFEASLDAEKLAEILSGMQEVEMKLSMPRFEFNTDIDLKTALTAMGAPLVFDRDLADLGGITTSERLYVNQALHKAYLKVDEQGTKAAAVSIIGIAFTSMPMEIHIDHPFLFIIRDKPTGTLLFMGRVTDPR